MARDPGARDPDGASSPIECPLKVFRMVLRGREGFDAVQGHRGRVRGVAPHQRRDCYERLQAGRAARDPNISDRAAGAPEPGKADANSTIKMPQESP